MGFNQDRYFRNGAMHFGANDIWNKNMTKQDEEDSNGDLIQLEIEERIKKQIVKENAAEFSKKLEQMVWEEDISYIEALTTLTEQSGYEAERVAKMLTPEVKAHIQNEAEDLSLIKKSNNRLDSLL